LPCLLVYFFIPIFIEKPGTKLMVSILIGEPDVRLVWPFKIDNSSKRKVCIPILKNFVELPILSLA